MRSDSCLVGYSSCLTGIYCLVIFIGCTIVDLSVSATVLFFPSMIIVLLNWPCWLYFVVLGVPVYFKQSVESARIWGYRGFRRVIEPEASGMMAWFSKTWQTCFKYIMTWHWRHATLRIWQNNNNKEQVWSAHKYWIYHWMSKHETCLSVYL